MAATVVMSLELTLAKGLGLLGEPPPKKLTRKMLHLAGHRPSRLALYAATTAAHLAYGAGAGALYAMSRRRGPRAGVAFGVAVWAASYLGWIPKVGLMPPPSRDRIGRPTSMVLAHVVFGGALDRTLRALERGEGDRTVAFLREGYAFISHRCEEQGTDSFWTRLAGKRVFCMRGEDAARLFYGGDHFTRIGANPPTVLHLLQGKGSVARLHGAAHAHRKRMFMSFMNEESVTNLMDRFAREWQRAIPEWRGRNIVLHDEIRPILCRAAAAWIGIPETDIEARTEEVAQMVDAAASIGPKAVRALWLRRRANRWARDLVERVREGTVPIPSDRPLFVIAHYRDANGRWISVEAAANEVLNLLRPIVAVSRYVVYAALALKEHPQPDLESPSALVHFAQEVRRLYPFFPAVAGRARVPLTFQGHDIAVGDLVVFDLWGTNHDPKIWLEPHVFRPSRFVTTPPTPFNLVPQGAGYYLQNHRCPGEPLAVALVERAALFLKNELSYTVPPQDLSIDLSQIPALPRSGFVISVS